MNREFPTEIDRYQIFGVLGKGGMGCVYKAYDPKMKKYVALKTMLGQAQKSDMQRFLIEAKTMAKINHPNIVQIYDVSLSNQTSFFTMSYIKGKTLKGYLKGSPKNIREFCLMMFKMSKAIDYAHKQKIIHRDLKPNNILVDYNKEPYITDFGLAKQISIEKSLTAKGTILGTPRYMSPEQARGEKVDYLTDVYALGAIFYEMLTSAPLVQGETTNVILYNIANREFKALRQIDKKLSIDLEVICTKATAKEKTKRYQSALEFAEDINRFLNGELIKAKPSTFLEKSKEKLYNNKLAITTGVVGIFLLCLGIFIVNFYQVKHTNKQWQKLLSDATKWEQKAKLQKNIELYIKASDYLEKALFLSSKPQIKEKFFYIQRQIGKLAREQRNYLLSYRALKKSQKLGDPRVQELFESLQKHRDKLKQKHKIYITKAMQKILPGAPEEVLNWHMFKMVKIGRPYIVKMLFPYLQSNNKWQKKLAIRTLGRLGNTHTKVEQKDTVEWLITFLRKYKNNRPMIVKEEEVVVELINALGWLRDSRANIPVYDIRRVVKRNDIFQSKTKVSYMRIPLSKTSAKSSMGFCTRGRMKLGKGNNLGAIADCTQAIALDPKNVEAYTTRALAYKGQKLYFKAIADYTTAITLDPENSLPHNNRGNLYRAIGKYQNAISDCSQAILINPEHSKAFVNRGLAYKGLKQYAKALSDYTQAIFLDPKSTFGFYNRGNLYLSQKKHQRAISDFTKVLSIDSLFSPAYSRRGAAYGELKQYSKAIADYTHAISLTPKQLLNYYERGEIYVKMREYTKAIIDFSQNITIDPKDKWAYSSRALVYIRLEKYAKAIPDLNKAILLDPSFTSAYYNRGNVYNSLKKYSKAIANYTRVISLNPRYAKAYRNRGLACLRSRQYQKAYRDFQIFLKLSPSHPTAPQVRSWLANLKK